ncbi:MAG: helix-turn-helix transcriptional regulator [Thermomicrobiales bacterium]
MDISPAAPYEIQPALSGPVSQSGTPLAGLTVPLVGRLHEQTVLRAQFKRMLDGHPGLVLIGGEGGSGKTALVESFGAEVVAGGAALAWGRCYDLAASPLFGPWMEIFARLAVHQDHESPAVSQQLTASMVAACAAHTALFKQVRDTLFVAAGRRPLVLLLDDLHWADAASLDLLRFLARSLGSSRLLIVGTYRVEDLDQQQSLYALLPILWHESQAVRLELRTLGTNDLRALIRARYALDGCDEARLLAYVQERSRGNPLFATELLRALETEGMLCQAESGWTLGSLTSTALSPALRHIIARRVARLGTGATEILAIAAVIGQQVSLPLWRAATNATEDALAELTERALAARILEEAANGRDVRFAHPLFHQTLYESLSLPSRQRWHRRIAEHLLTTPDPDPGPVADHFSLAGDRRAVVWLIRAGDLAQQRYAYLTAQARYTAALVHLARDQADPTERGWLLVRLAWVTQFTDPAAAHTALHEAVQIGAADPLLLIAARFDRGVLRCFNQQFRAGLADLAAALTLLEERAELEQDWRIIEQWRGTGGIHHASPYNIFALGLAVAGRYDEATAISERMLSESSPLAPAPEDDATDLIWSQAVVAAGRGDAMTARRTYHRAREEYAGRANSTPVALLALEELQWVALPYAADQPALLRQLADVGEAALASANAVFDRVPPRCAWLPLLLLTGAWAEARQLAAPVAAGGTPFAEVARIALGTIARAQGDVAAAWSIVEVSLPAEAASLPGDVPFHYALAMMRLGAQLALDAKNLVQARDWLAAHDRWLAWSGAVLGQVEGRLAWAAYHRAAGNRSLAVSEAEQALAQAKRPRQPLALLATHRLLGILATEAGQASAALPHFAAAGALADACGAPYERALTLLAEAEARFALKQLALARSLVATARASGRLLAAALPGAAALDDRLTPPSPVRLTAREVEVLRLVTEGATNATVASRLGLSRRTVDHHLRAIYGKLGVTSRTAAAHCAITQGLL